MLARLTCSGYIYIYKKKFLRLIFFKNSVKYFVPVFYCAYLVFPATWLCDPLVILIKIRARFVFSLFS